MANFPPMKERFLLVLEDSLSLFSIRGRFLDYGCGSGDVSEFLIHKYGLKDGLGYDLALTEADVSKRNGQAGLHDFRYANKLDGAVGKFDLTVLFDVIEHVPNADEVLQEIHRLTQEDGWLAVTVPYNANEWGVDDEFYGHLRRLSWRGIVTMLENNGWSVVRVLDPTFPSFWFLRKIYLQVVRFTKKFPSNQQGSTETELEKTLASSRRNAWETWRFVPKLLSSSLVPWRLIRRFDLYFESFFGGFELFLLCQKRQGHHKCEVCVNGVYSYHRFFDRYSLQKCSYCGSELVLSKSQVPACETASGRKVISPLHRLLVSFDRCRIRQIERLDSPAPSLLEINTARGVIPAYFKARGWRALGTVRGAQAGAAAASFGAELLDSDFMQLPAAPQYGVLALYHVIEHVADLQSALSQLDRLLLPGGYLILEYPNGRSLLKRLLGWRWFGFDPPFQRLQIDPCFLADHLGMKNFRLVAESHFSMAYSFFLFAQSWVNTLLPFQRDALYKFIRARKLDAVEKVSAVLSLPLFLALAPLFLLYQPLVSLLRRGCVVRQVFKKMSCEQRPPH